MRVTLLPTDAAGNTQPFPYTSGDGAGTASGLEFEVVWAPTDRLKLNYGLGLIDTKYIQAGCYGSTAASRATTPARRSLMPPRRAARSALSTRFRRRTAGAFLLVGNYG